MTHPTLEKLLKEFERFDRPHDVLESGGGGVDANCDIHPRLTLTAVSAALTVAFEAGKQANRDAFTNRWISEARAELLKTLREEAPSLNCNNDTINEFLALLDKHQEPTT